MVHVVSPPNPSPAKTYNTREEALESLGGTVPPNRRIFPYSERNEPTTAGQASDAGKEKKWVVVEWPAVVDGSELRNAAATQMRGARGLQISFAVAHGAGIWSGPERTGQYMAGLECRVKGIAISSLRFCRGDFLSSLKRR